MNKLQALGDLGCSVAASYLTLISPRRSWAVSSTTSSLLIASLSSSPRVMHRTSSSSGSSSSSSPVIGNLIGISKGIARGNDGYSEPLVTIELKLFFNNPNGQHLILSPVDNFLTPSVVSKIGIQDACNGSLHLVSTSKKSSWPTTHGSPSSEKNAPFRGYAEYALPDRCIGRCSFLWKYLPSRSCTLKFNEPELYVTVNRYLSLFTQATTGAVFSILSMRPKRLYLRTNPREPEPSSSTIKSSSGTSSNRPVTSLSGSESRSSIGRSDSLNDSLSETTESNWAICPELVPTTISNDPSARPQEREQASSGKLSTLTDLCDLVSQMISFWSRPTEAKYCPFGDHFKSTRPFSWD
ncbi:hypothetical protein OGAPHI_004434 [Ogataea philodendri]|uniref:Uncharacterized protein n=1 Tax=Ogataea philodendri TaxID=1378263 RepID=A0A9P8T5M8_9ASCO|nr:uncharacterized protein OGAPHI_004434 [Ogataea philodendri]KAH3666245.1 hypothetical protein OGAPHI_004434 [Ogataea philodendri]